MRTRPALIVVLLAAAVSGATCRGNGTQTTPPAKPDEVPVEAAAKAAPASLDGVDLSRVPPESRADLVRLLGEHSCYCGCARTLSGCLAAKADCPCVKCSERMVEFVLRQYEGGSSTDEIESELLEGFATGFNAAPKTFDLEGRPSKGAADAKYTIVEFADFRCGHCRAAFQPLADLLAKNPDVRLVFFAFPIGQNSDSPSHVAAEAAHEAHAQGKFWEFAKVLFDNQHATEVENLLAYGAMVGLDVAKLKIALDKRVHRGRVEADRKLGLSVPIEATPTLFVNGRPFGLRRTLENFELRIMMESERGRCE